MDDIFVVDLGFSSAKCLYGRQMFRVASAYKEQGGGALVVGDEALYGTGTSYLRTPEDLVCRYPAFVKYCMAKAGVSRPVSVAVGVPYGFWNDQSILPGEGMLGSIKTGLMQVENINHVEVYPQGLGGIRAFMDIEAVTGNLLAIDIGFNTVIYNLWDSAQKALIHADTLYKRGMTQMATEHLKPKISRYTPGYSYSPIELSVVLENGFIQYGMDRIDIKPEIEVSTQEYTERIVGDIMGELRAHAGPRSHFESLLIFGGGAHYLGKVFAQKANKHLVVHVLDEPEYANSIGFASLLADERTANA